MSQVPQVVQWHRKGIAKGSWLVPVRKQMVGSAQRARGRDSHCCAPACFSDPSPSSRSLLLLAEGLGRLTHSCYKQLLRPGVSYGPLEGPMGGPPRTWSLRARGGWFPISTPGKCFGRADVSEARLLILFLSEGQQVIVWGSSSPGGMIESNLRI